MNLIRKCSISMNLNQMPRHPIHSIYRTFCSSNSSTQYMVPKSIPGIVEIEPRSRSLHVKWENQTSSKYREFLGLLVDWLREHCYSRRSQESRVHKYEPITWNKDELIKHGMPTYEYKSIMESDKGLYQLLNSINSLGIAIAKDAPLSLLTVGEISRRIAIPRNTMYGEVWDVKSVPDPINVAYTSDAIVPHQDLCYYESPPGLQLLHCIQFDQKKGGENGFLDGFRLADDLKNNHPDCYEMLCNFRQSFQKIGHDHEYYYNHPIISVNTDVDLRSIFWSPPFEGVLDIPSEAVEVYYWAKECFASMTRDEQYIVEYRLSPGDIAIFNNRRILHSREAYDETDGIRHLQGTYIDIDDYLSKLRILSKKYKEAHDVIYRCGNFSI